MTYWNVHVTLRDAHGDVTREYCGAHPIERLPDVLEQAFHRAGLEGGGVQVSAKRDWPGAQPEPLAG